MKLQPGKRLAVCKTSRRGIASSCLIWIALLHSVAPLNSCWGDDWPQWGGPARDMVWREKGIVQQLPDTELPRLWSVPIAAGYAGPAVAQGRVFVMDRLEEAGVERLQVFATADGAKLWQYQYPCQYTVSYPLGPRATPTVDGNRVYTLGAM